MTLGDLEKTLEIWAFMEGHYNLGWLMSGKLSLRKFLKGIIEIEIKKIPETKKSIKNITESLNKSPNSYRETWMELYKLQMKSLESSELRLSRAKAFLQEMPKRSH